ncbi:MULTISPECIES: hypothetical protein [unclassified Pseudomonas]|uniref:hypothetical protein n=1 Tax=unclassified Pseudomonas TaxID=196821 RepID=UPI0015B50389|nr:MULTISPECIES: hypothetical protein [unclassified Pseudomonas]
MAPRIDRIAAMLNCPIKGADIRQAIKESRKDSEDSEELEDDSEDSEDSEDDSEEQEAL